MDETMSGRVFISKDEPALMKTDVQAVLSKCLPCKFCNEKCMYVEEVEDWDGKGTVVRIGSDCEKGMAQWDKDDARTIGF
jgi:Fe-S oxidoreductase